MFDPKDVPYFNQREKVEIEEARCLNCDDIFSNHIEGDCLFNGSKWCINVLMLPRLDEKSIIKERGLYMPKGFEEPKEVDDEDTEEMQMMRRLLNGALTN